MGIFEKITKREDIDIKEVKKGNRADVTVKVTDKDTGKENLCNVGLFSDGRKWNVEKREGHKKACDIADEELEKRGFLD